MHYLSAATEFFYTSNPEWPVVDYEVRTEHYKPIANRQEIIESKLPNICSCHQDAARFQTSMWSRSAELANVVVRRLLDRPTSLPGGSWDSGSVKTAGAPLKIGRGAGVVCEGALRRCA
jgi:hypothetical protein